MRVTTLLAGIAFFVVPSFAHAQDAVRSSSAVPPFLAMDAGMGMGQITLAQSRFGTVTGAQLGLFHPSGLVFDATMHVFPFKLRNIGLVTTFEMLGTSPDGTPPSTISSDDSPSTFSLITGPEAQARLDMFVLRAAALAGFRSTSFGNYTSNEPRIAFRTQADIVFGACRKDDAGLAFGTYASLDVVPALGWTWGISLTFAMF